VITALPRTSAVPRKRKTRTARRLSKSRFLRRERMLTKSGPLLAPHWPTSRLRRRSTAMLPQSKRITTVTVGQTWFLRGLVRTCTSQQRLTHLFHMYSHKSWHRLMILVFTSTAFTNFVRNHVNITSDSTFNPYLTFLFFAMYVHFPLYVGITSDIIIAQGWHVCHAFRRLSHVPHSSTTRPVIPDSASFCGPQALPF
jgi:hypothetical protein